MFWHAEQLLPAYMVLCCCMMQAIVHCILAAGLLAQVNNLLRLVCCCKPASGACFHCQVCYKQKGTQLSCTLWQMCCYQPD